MVAISNLQHLLFNGNVKKSRVRRYTQEEIFFMRAI
jgi:hypothetical protein